MIEFWEFLMICFIDDRLKYVHIYIRWASDVFYLLTIVSQTVTLFCRHTYSICSFTRVHATYSRYCITLKNDLTLQSLCTTATLTYLHTHNKIKYNQLLTHNMTTANTGRNGIFWQALCVYSLLMLFTLFIYIIM